MNTPKPNARFLPTLTEVVHPGIAQVAAEPGSMATSQPDVAQRAMELLEARLGERLEVLIKEQAQNVLETLREEMRQAVAEALAQTTPASE